MWLSGKGQEAVWASSKYPYVMQKSANVMLSLAHAELYMAMAAVFRNFEFELYQTDLSDVELAHDFFLPSPRLDSKGVRVKVKP